MPRDYPSEGEYIIIKQIIILETVGI